ncbi:MAG: YtxH domain-containing protein [Bacteroidota bacterium]
MNLEEIVAKVAKEAGISKPKAHKAVSATLDYMKDQDSLQSKIKGFAGEAKEKLGDLVEDTKEKLGDLAEDASEAFDKLKGAASKTFDNVKDKFAGDDDKKKDDKKK